MSLRRWSSPIGLTFLLLIACDAVTARPAPAAPRILRSKW